MPPGTRVRAGQDIYTHGDPFVFLYSVLCGAVKSTVTLPDGRTHICAFHFEGDIFALDGLALGTHGSTATALEDSHIHVVHPACVGDAFPAQPIQRRSLSRLMSREISRGHRLQLLLGAISAPERVAAFLLDLSQRVAENGFSARDFELRMTRADIGTFLGLRLETISRILSLFQAQGLLLVDNRRIRITDLPTFAGRYEALLRVH